MPITAKQFELGIDTEIEGWMRKIHQFLASHKEEAFTDQELAEHLEGFAGKERRKAKEGVLWNLDYAFKVALDKLVEIRAVGSREIHGKWYYALGDVPLPL